MKRLLKFVALCLALLVSACANVGQWDKVFRGHAGLVHNVPPERMGVLLGSIALVPPRNSITGISLHLRPLGDARNEMGIFASNREFNIFWRQPDVDTPEERSWTYSGQLPAGVYEIPKAGISVGSVHNVHWYELSRPLRVNVTAGGTVYLGRWEINDYPEKAAGPKIVFKDSDLLIRDASVLDRGALEAKRERSKVPHPGGPFENALAQWIAIHGETLDR